MTREKMAASGSPGLVIPIDVEALCIGKDPGAIFEQIPFDFSKLQQGSAYLSSALATGAPTTLSQGVHLHWALPDALTQGAEGGGSVSFPAVPDRWLVTRIFCDPDRLVKPRFDRWIIESNYYAPTDPNQPLGRSAVAMPYQGPDWESQPHRYLGKVSDFTAWVEANGNFAAGSAESYVAGLSAVGYGQADFAASYQNSRNILGFNDLGTDLNQLGTAGSDKYLSYHVIGWYSHPAKDPIRQLPARVPVAVFNELLAKVSDPGDQAFLRDNFKIVTYTLIEHVPTQTGQALWRILQAAGYPLKVDIPVEINPTDFQTVLTKTVNPSDKDTLQKSYLAKLAPASDLSDADKVRLWNIMAAAGYDFLADLLSRAKWSLPSGTATPANSPAYTFYSGLISNVRWNAQTDYFTNDPGQNFKIAIGNTAGEALSALIANTSGLTPDRIPIVEEILDALQAGILPLITKTDMLKDWELLKETLHKNSFGSARGGYLWEVRASQNSPQASGEITLPASLALELNQLNLSQLKLNELETRIASIRSQIFADWYRFMWINYPGSGDDSCSNIDLAGLAQYITDKISLDKIGLQCQVDDAANLASSIHTQITVLQQALGDSYFLAQITAPRYWQANDPVLLFQGDGIKPSDRYGNDGRYMYNRTLACRLTGQLLSSLQIPAGAFGNTAAVTLDAAQFETMPNPNSLPLLVGIDAVFVDAGLLNEDVIASHLRVAGATASLADLAKTLDPLIHAFLCPEVPPQIAEAQFNTIAAALSPDDRTFLQTWYTLTGTDYKLKNTPTDEERLRLQYLLNSAAYNPSQAQLAYTGLPFSEVGLQAWNGNPWLPFSLRWSVWYYPFQQVPTTQAPTYPADFITSQFGFGDTDLVYTGQPFSPSTQGLQPYSNTIFLTPHANINLQKQLRRFIETHPADPIMDELKLILSKLPDKPILSQALSGFNQALLMLQKEMQLPVSDPNPSPFYNFTNKTVKPVVEDKSPEQPAAGHSHNTERPAPGNSYNPIRVGLMEIASITLVDVFGRNVQVQQPQLVFRAQDMQQTVLTPVTNIYLPPRLTQASRLLFRWLSAGDDTVEMNTHPATTPICGWVLANHLDNSLWIYDRKGNVYGALILNWDQSQVLWQCAPGSPYFGLDAPSFFNQLGEVNTHLKAFVLTLYGNGGPANATYLKDFMQALDVAATTIEPANYAQYQTNAALMGRPLALVRASLNLELRGEPAYNQSCTDLANQVTQDNLDTPNFIWGNDYGFTQVNFPVKIGNVPQTSDGLIGYFKDNDYGTFYAPAVKAGNPRVLPPPVNNLVVKCATDSPPVVISMLIEPRGEIHATTGILPVKTINLPPDQYVDALEKLSLAFLTAPLLTSQSQLALPLPAQQSGAWSWVENHGSAWAQTQHIAPVTVDAVMNYAPQQLLEGWLNLSNVLFSTALFKLLNTKANAAVLYLTDDPSLNAMTFTFVNRTNKPLHFTGGAPVSQPYQSGGASLAFNFGTMLPATVLSGMQVSAAGWTAHYFPSTAKTPALWSVAPNTDLTLAPGDAVTFALQGLTGPPGTVAGNFQIFYYGLPNVPDSLAPLLLPVAVQTPPTH